MKRQFKCMVSLLLALVLSLTLCVPALAAGDFPDIAGPEWDWAREAVRFCAEQGTVKGYEDGNFGPDDPVTSVQFIVMLTRTFYADKVAEIAVPAGEPWYYPNVQAAADVGVSEGMKAIDENPIDRYEMALVLYNTMVANDKKATSAQKANAINTIKDYKSIPTSPTNYRPAVQNCYGLGIITGMDDGSFSGESNMNRAQACVVIKRMTDLLNGTAAPTQPSEPSVQPTEPTQPDQPAQPEAPAETEIGKLANGQDATVENVQAILEEIRAEYPDGTIWTADGTANNNYYAGGPSNPTDGTRDIGVLNRQFKSQTDPSFSTSLQYGCGGFACMVSERIFGKTGAPGRQVNSISEMRPGDIIFDIDPKTGYLTHVSIVYKVGQVDGKWYYSTCGGNVKQAVKWNETLGTYGGSVISTNANTRYVYTRYPE